MKSVKSDLPLIHTSFSNLSDDSTDSFFSSDIDGYHITRICTHEFCAEELLVRLVQSHLHTDSSKNGGSL